MKLKAGEGKGRIALFGVVAVAAFTMLSGVALADGAGPAAVNGELTAAHMSSTATRAR